MGELIRLAEMLETSLRPGPGAFVPECPLLGGQALSRLQGARRPPRQDADLGEADPQQPRAEAVLGVTALVFASAV